MICVYCEPKSRTAIVWAMENKSGPPARNQVRKCAREQRTHDALQTVAMNQNLSLLFSNAHRGQGTRSSSDAAE